MTQSLFVTNGPQEIFYSDEGTYLGTFDKYLIMSEMELVVSPHICKHVLATCGEEISGDELSKRLLRIVCGPPALSEMILGNTHTVAISKGKAWDLHVCSDGIRQSPGKGMLGLLLQVVMDVSPEKLPGYYGSFKEIDMLIDWRLR